MYTPSSSSVDRLVRCAASHILPRHGSITLAAERGTELHKHLDVLSVETDPIKIDESLQRVPADWRQTALRIDISEAIAGINKIRTEVSFAVDQETGKVREIGDHINRNYGPLLLPGEIPGTADVVGLRSDGIPVVLDWKSGRDVGEISYYWQLRFFAMALAGLTGSALVEVRIGYIRASGEVDVEQYEFNAFELDEFAAILKQAHRRLVISDQQYLETGRVEATTGDHCSFCPSINNCPPHTALAKSMLPSLDEVAGSIHSMTDTDAGRAWRKYQTIKRLLERVGKSLKTRALSSPLPLGGGMIAGQVQCKRKSFSEEKAVKLLRDKGASEQEIRKCYSTTYYSMIKELHQE